MKKFINFKKVFLLILITVITIICILFLSNDGYFPVNNTKKITVRAYNDNVKPLVLNYEEMEVPKISSYFKSYMDYRAVTDKNSPQYSFIHTYGWCDENGFIRANGERDLGINDDYYLIALGSYYGTTIGTKYRITLDTGRIFYGVLGDCKANIHTNSTNQYSGGKNIVEFLVDTRYLRNDVKYHGSANVYMPLNGNVQKIERIDFVYE